MDDTIRRSQDIAKPHVASVPPVSFRRPRPPLLDRATKLSAMAFLTQARTEVCEDKGCRKGLVEADAMVRLPEGLLSLVPKMIAQ
jgi:hypothetical protein